MGYLDFGCHRTTLLVDQGQWDAMDDFIKGQLFEKTFDKGAMLDGLIVLVKRVADYDATDVFVSYYIFDGSTETLLIIAIRILTIKNESLQWLG